MDIRNATQFVSFISKHGLKDLNPVFNQLFICIGDFSRACHCHTAQDKNKLYIKCNSLYITSAGLAANQYKHQFLDKTSERQLLFYSDNGTLIGMATR